MGALKRRIAELCARLRCPNPYLALESLTKPKEVWWLNSFLSDSDKERVERTYARSEPLTTELLRLSRSKEALTFDPITVLARYRRDLSEGAPWRVSGARFFVVIRPAKGQETGVVVFEAPDGDLYMFAPAATLAEAQGVASRNAGASVIFAVQPGWSFPADAWIAADPDFWRASPAARGR